MPATVKVEISHDGMNVYASALRPNLQIKHGFLSDKIKQVGAVSFSYGLNGGIRRIGNLHVDYDWSGNVKRVTGRDDRVEVVVFTHAESQSNGGRKSNFK